METDARQGQISQAALEMISEGGVSALNISGIAERVGLVPSALYRHFKSKDEMLDSVLDLLKGRLMLNVAKAREETPDAIQRLELLLTSHARMLSENKAIPYVVFSDGIYSGNPKRKAKVAEIITSYLTEIERIIDEGKKDGSIRRETVPNTASVMFLGMVLSAAVLWNVTEGRFDMVEHVGNAWPSFLRCIENNA